MNTETEPFYRKVRQREAGRGESEMTWVRAFRTWRR